MRGETENETEQTEAKHGKVYHYFGGVKGSKSCPQPTTMYMPKKWGFSAG